MKVVPPVAGPEAELARLSRSPGPWLHLLDAAPADARQLGWLLGRDGVVVRTLRGHCGRSTYGFLDEVGAALQLPGDPAEDWPSLASLLTDMAWLPGIGHVLVVTRASLLLAAESVAELRGLVEAVREVARGRAEEGDPVPFHLVLQDDSVGLATLRERLDAVGARHSALSGWDAEEPEADAAVSSRSRLAPGDADPDEVDRLAGRAASEVDGVRSVRRAWEDFRGGASGPVRVYAPVLAEARSAVAVAAAVARAVAAAGAACVVVPVPADPGRADARQAAVAAATTEIWPTPAPAAVPSAAAPTAPAPPAPASSVPVPPAAAPPAAAPSVSVPSVSVPSVSVPPVPVPSVPVPPAPGPRASEPAPASPAVPSASPAVPSASEPAGTVPAAPLPPGPVRPVSTPSTVEPPGPVPAASGSSGPVPPAPVPPVERPAPEPAAPGLPAPGLPAPGRAGTEPPVPEPAAAGTEEERPGDRPGAPFELVAANLQWPFDSGPDTTDVVDAALLAHAERSGRTAGLFRTWVRDPDDGWVRVVLGYVGPRSSIADVDAERTAVVNVLQRAGAARCCVEVLAAVDVTDAHRWLEQRCHPLEPPTPSAADPCPAAPVSERSAVLATDAGFRPGPGEGDPEHAAVLADLVAWATDRAGVVGLLTAWTDGGAFVVGVALDGGADPDDIRVEAAAAAPGVLVEPFAPSRGLDPLHLRLSRSSTRVWTRRAERARPEPARAAGGSLQRPGLPAVTSLGPPPVRDTADPRGDVELAGGFRLVGIDREVEIAKGFAEPDAQDAQLVEWARRRAGATALLRGTATVREGEIPVYCLCVAEGVDPEGARRDLAAAVAGTGVAAAAAEAFAPAGAISAFHLDLAVGSTRLWPTPT